MLTNAFVLWPRRTVARPVSCQPEHARQLSGAMAEHTQSVMDDPTLAFNSGSSLGLGTLTAGSWPGSDVEFHELLSQLLPDDGALPIDLTPPLPSPSPIPLQSGSFSLSPDSQPSSGRQQQHSDQSHSQGHSQAHSQQHHSEAAHSQGESRLFARHSEPQYSHHSEQPHNQRRSPGATNQAGHGRMPPIDRGQPGAGYVLHNPLLAARLVQQRSAAAAMGAVGGRLLQGGGGSGPKVGTSVSANTGAASTMLASAALLVGASDATEMVPQQQQQHVPHPVTPQQSDLQWRSDVHRRSASAPQPVPSLRPQAPPQAVPMQRAVTMAVTPSAYSTSPGRDAVILRAS